METLLSYRHCKCPQVPHSPNQWKHYFLTKESVTHVQRDNSIACVRRSENKSTDCSPISKSGLKARADINHNTDENFILFVPCMISSFITLIQIMHSFNISVLQLLQRYHFARHVSVVIRSSSGAYDGNGYELILRDTHPAYFSVY
jgi:hypothetical protein